MANEVFVRAFKTDHGPHDVTAVGSSQGPPGGDAWQIVARLEKTRLEAGRHYVFMVSGTYGDFQWTGATPNRGIAQVCLGDSSGLKHPEYRAQAFITTPVPPRVGIPFHFMVIFSASPVITDPLWGATWSNTEDLVLWARVYRGGDPAGWNASFTVNDVNWQAWDLDVMASTEHLVEEYYPARPPSGNPALNNLRGAGPKTHYITNNTPGQTGEKWLHFMSAWTESRGNGAGAAQLQHGYVTDGTSGTFFPKLGGAGKWGLETKGVNGIGQLQNPMEQLGGFFPLDQVAGSSFRLAVRGEDWHNQANRETLIYRWRYFGVKIEVLPDVAAASATPLKISTASLGQAWWEHDPGPLEATTGPIYMVHGILSAFTPGRRSHGWLVGKSTGQDVWVPQAFCQTQDAFEGVPVMAFGRYKRGLGGPPFVYRNTFLRVQGEPFPTLLDVVDNHAIQFHPIKDPTRVPPTKPSEPAPIVIVPDREGPDVSALLELPVAVTGEVEELPSMPVESVRGVTGYRRTWFHLFGMRRTFRIPWQGLRRAEVDSLNAFFAAQPTFKWKPGQESEFSAMVLLERPTASLVDARGVWSYAITAAELVFTGP